MRYVPWFWWWLFVNIFPNKCYSAQRWISIELVYMLGTDWFRIFAEKKRLKFQAFYRITRKNAKIWTYIDSNIFRVGVQPISSKKCKWWYQCLFCLHRKKKEFFQFFAYFFITCYRSLPICENFCIQVVVVVLFIRQINFLKV